MIEEAFIGYPINFQDICLVYPPFNKDIIAFGYQKFMVLTSLLTQTQDDIDDQLADAKLDQNPTPFQQLFLQATLYPPMKIHICEILKFFTHMDIRLLPEIGGIVFGEVTEKRIITEETFFDFQNVIRAAIGNKLEEKPKENENPHIRRMKALSRKRDRIKAKQHKAPQELLTLLTSVCCMNTGLNPSNVGEITYAATKSLIDRYTEKDAYETRIASALAGAQSEGKEQTYWIRDLDS